MGTSPLVPQGWSVCRLCLSCSGNNDCKALGLHARGLTEGCVFRKVSLWTLFGSRAAERALPQEGAAWEVW